MTGPLADRLAVGLAGRYSVQRLLGQGGMASVFLAEPTGGGQVAIKALRPELAQTIGADRFLREIELERVLDHPGIIRILDSGDADGVPFYVMPFIEGESLRDRLDREPALPLDEALRIARAAADALAYAHAKGIIHRDVKPENILLSGNEVVLADFGIARAVETAGGERLTQTGMIVGTPSYLAPELTSALGGPTPAADQYGLGCVVYEMLAGGPPFKGPNSVAIMARHALDTPPSLRVVRPEIPEHTERAILRALAKQPPGRFPDVGMFADALEGKVSPDAGAPPVAAAASAPESRTAAAPVAKKGCAGLLILAAATAGLLAGSAGWLLAAAR